VRRRVNANVWRRVADVLENSNRNSTGPTRLFRTSRVKLFVGHREPCSANPRYMHVGTTAFFATADVFGTAPVKSEEASKFTQRLGGGETTSFWADSWKAMPEP